MNAHNEQHWPEYLMLRDTGLYDDAGGLGQHIFTTAGAGYVKQKYVRADLAAQPAAAQEAAGWQVFNSVVGAWQDASKSQYESRKAHYPEEARELYAAPVTAAPVDHLHAHLLHMLGAKDHEDAGRIIGELHAATMRTPAAPGIDLEPFRRLVEWNYDSEFAAYEHGHRTEEQREESEAERTRLLALIDASPKGGSEALDAARWRAVDAASSNTTLRLHSARPGERAKVIDAAMQAQTDEAPTYTTGHCENHRRPGGCPLHNLQCGYPQCDRRQAGDAEVRP